MPTIDVIFKINYVDLEEMKKVKNALYESFLKTDATNPASSTLSLVIQTIQDRIEYLEKKEVPQ